GPAIIRCARLRSLAAGGQVLVSAATAARRGPRAGRDRRGGVGRARAALTESRVVELVAAGLPNREIAGSLFVSLATAKTHPRAHLREARGAHRAARHHRDHARPRRTGTRGRRAPADTTSQSLPGGP